MTADPSIHVIGLGKAFGGHLVLDDGSLGVRPGEAVALLGPNGAGKSTLLRILATLLRASRGTARVAGYDCSRQPESVRARVGLLAHGPWVYEDLTALENLKFWATLGGLPNGPEALGGALAAVELDRVADERVRTFSLGMKRRLALARLVLAHPPVLLLHEPFAGVDQRPGKRLDGHPRPVQGAAGALPRANPNFRRGLGVADRIAILAGGRGALDTPLGALAPGDGRRVYDLHPADGA